MTPSTLKPGLREFEVILNYYQEMCPKSSHILQPLTRLTSKNVKCILTYVKQKALDEVKQLVACNNLLNCPEFNK